MDVQHLADVIVTKFKPGSHISKEWMHEQFGFDFKTAKATEAISYALTRGALQQELFIRNRVLAPSKKDGWKVLTKEEHHVYAEKELMSYTRQAYRRAGDIMAATDMKGMDSVTRKAHEDTKNFIATFRDIAEKAFARKDVFATFGKVSIKEDA